MFSILDINLRRSPIPIVATDLTPQALGWELNPGSNQGHLLLDPFNFVLAWRWEGLELFSVEAEIAFAKPTPDTHTPNFQQSISGTWTGVADPVYYGVEDARALILTWSGPLQFQLRIDRRPDGTSPILGQLRLGYHSIGDMSDYVFRFLLAKVLRISARISRPIKVTGSTTPIPAGFEPTKISDPQLLLIPSGEKLVGTVVGNNLSFSRSLAGEVAHLHFMYPLALDADSQTLTQIESIPVGFFRSIQSVDTHRINARNKVRVNNQEVIESIYHQSWSVTAELVIFADRLADARIYADKAAAAIRSAAVIDTPAYGHPIGLHLLGPVQNGPNPLGSGTPISSALYSAVVKFKVTNLLGGDIVRYNEREVIGSGVEIFTYTPNVP